MSSLALTKSNAGRPLTHIIPPSKSTLVTRSLWHAIQSFEFYRERLAGETLSSLSDPIALLDVIPELRESDFPILQREVLDRLWGRNFLLDKTTGTTGDRRYRVSSERDDEAESHVCRSFFRQIGIGETDRVLALDIDSADVYLFYGAVLRHELGVDDFVFSTLSGEFSESVDYPLRLKPTVLLTVPTLLSRILPRLRSLKQSGHLGDLRSVVYIGEPMQASLRWVLEREFGLSVFSFYGTTETGSVAGECRSHDGLHIIDDCVIPTMVEAVGGEGTLHGEVLWTTLQFQDQPLVKFAPGDLVEITEAPCTCGSPGPRILSLSRIQDQFSLFGHSFHHAAFVRSLSLLPQPEDLAFLQIEVLSHEDGANLTFRLPEALKPRRAWAEERIQQTDELSYFLDLGFIFLDLEFSDRPLREGRKLRKVLHRTE